MTAQIPKVQYYLVFLTFASAVFCTTTKNCTCSSCRDDKNCNCNCLFDKRFVKCCVRVADQLRWLRGVEIGAARAFTPASDLLLCVGHHLSGVVPGQSRFYMYIHELVWSIAAHILLPGRWASSGSTCCSMQMFRRFVSGST